MAAARGAAMSDVFVSYKAEDRARVAPLVRALESDGLSVWWDTQIAAGAEWREDIQEELDAAGCVVVVWSKRSVGHGGRFVRDEASRAQRRGTYLPVRIDKVEPPLGFGELHAIPLQGWKGSRDDPRFRHLLDAVHDVRAGRLRRRWRPKNQARSRDGRCSPAAARPRSPSPAWAPGRSSSPARRAPRTASPSCPSPISAAIRARTISRTGLPRSCAAPCPGFRA